MELGMDERAQAMQVGFIILFAFLLILFAVYQAVVVPNQNAAVEFNHNERVQADMLDLRNALLSAKSTGDDQHVTVELGTRFPARVIAINPAPPSGNLETTEPRPIVIQQGGSDITDQVCPATDVTTRFVEYTPDYRAYSGVGTLRYENSLLYHDFGSEVVFRSNQQLVRGDRVQIIPLTGEYSESGSGTVAFEAKAGLLDTSQRADITVIIPTELSEEQWERALDGEVDAANISVANGNATIVLGGERTISCGPVGAGDYPPSGQRADGEADGINPASPGDIKLADVRVSGSVVSLDFNNTGGTNNFTRGRISFYEAQGGGGGGGGGGSEPSEADIYRVGEPVSATLEIGGDYEPFNPDITVRGDGTTTTVELDFDTNVNPNDWFVITLDLESGEQVQYFVSP